MIIRVKEPIVICYRVCSLPDWVLVLTVPLPAPAGRALVRSRF